MKAILTQQGTLVKIKTERQALTRSYGKRGKVTEFSKASRKRLLELFATIDAKKYLFITLTYGANFPDTPNAKRHLKAFMMRLERRYKRLCGVWRLEYQERGAPHFHLILMNVPFIPAKMIVDLWEAVIGEEYANNTFNETGDRNRTFTRVEAIRKHKKVMAYISKYVAKKERKDTGKIQSAVGQHKLNFRANQDAPTAWFSDAPASTGFNNDTYQHEGRWWGKFNEDFFPFADETSWEFEGSATIYYAFRNEVKAVNLWMQVYRVNDGLSFFCDCAKKWLELFASIFHASPQTLTSHYCTQIS
jgi:hypothetical protein